MTGSFLFVKPSDPEGKHGTAYSDAESPRYHYDHASWEWLLERALRRMLFSGTLLTKSHHSRELLYGHEDKYSMHRWGSYGESNTADITPNEYKGVGGDGASSRKTDANLSQDDRKALLPRLDSSGSPSYTETKVAYGIADLEEMVALLPFGTNEWAYSYKEWLPPDWSSNDLSAWDITANTKETTRGLAPASPDGLAWTWSTSVAHTPYAIPAKAPFKCLSHMRTDDPTTTVNITNDDNETIAVELSPTPSAVPRTTDGSIREFHGTQVRSGEGMNSAAIDTGWVLSEFYIPCWPERDYGDSTDNQAYSRKGKAGDTYEGSTPTIGCLVDIPGKDSGNIMVASLLNDGAGFAHEVDWDGKPTWWHGNNFPKGLDSVLSTKLKIQLKALCPVCQPAIPPAIPAFRIKFPEPGVLPWDYAFTHLSGKQYMYQQAWTRHLNLACTPLDISARLDAMTTTIHRVNMLFAKIKTVTTTHKTEGRVSTSSPGSRSWWQSTELEEVTIEGTTTNPLHAAKVSGDSVLPGKVSGSRTTRDINTSSSTVRTDVIQYTKEWTFKSTSDFLVCLRSTEHTMLSTKTTTKTSKTTEYSNRDPVTKESESSYGELPKSYDPDPDDLLFPDWLLPWIESAELFASIESRLGHLSGYTTTTTETHYTPKGGSSTHNYSGSGNGTRTHKTHRKIVSLGSMDTTTGRFPSVDAAKVLSGVDPDPSEPTFTHDINGNVTHTARTDSKGGKTETTVATNKYIAEARRSRSVSYYVVVKWKFDRTDPESLETESPLADLYRKLADAEKALSDKERELSDAQSALAKAESDLESAEAALEYAQGQLEDPEGAEPGLLEEAQAALYSADEALTEAQEKKTIAQAECDRAEERMKSAEERLQSAQAAYDAAVEAGEGIEEAQAALEMAYPVYNKAVGDYGEAYEKLENAEANETIAQADYAAAQEYYDTLHDRIEEILQKAVDDAQAAVDDANSRIEEWTEKVGELKKEIPDLEDAVKAAKQAIRDAGGKVD